MRYGVRVFAAIVGLALFGAFAQSGERTIRDGIYSDEQATRGRSTYDAQCSSCHDGGGMGPAVKGDEFLAAWDGKTVRALYDRILTTMPSDAPGTLQERETLDLVAYLIRVNGFPSGDKAFAGPGDLDGIRIVRGK
jgi:mono/diheme cytochrome c family protein